VALALTVLAVAVTLHLPQHIVHAPRNGVYVRATWLVSSGRVAAEPWECAPRPIRASPPHAGPTGGDSAPAAAFGAWPHACTGAPGRHTPREPHRTGHRSPAAAGRSRHTSWLLPLPPCARFSPGSPPLAPAASHQRGHASAQPPPPPSPHASLLHVSTRAATDHPPTDCDRPNHVSLLLDCTRPLTLKG
jgi:hypothetical protein